MKYVSNTPQTVFAIVGLFSFIQQLFIVLGNGDIVVNKTDTRPNLVGDPVKQRCDALMGKAQGTGQRIGWVGEQVTTNPVLGLEGLVFLLARSLVTA